MARSVSIASDSVSPRLLRDSAILPTACVRPAATMPARPTAAMKMISLVATLLAMLAPPVGFDPVGAGDRDVGVALAFRHDLEHVAGHPQRRAGVVAHAEAGEVVGVGAVDEDVHVVGGTSRLPLFVKFANVRSDPSSKLDEVSS
jgi:hypothetical protein